MSETADRSQMRTWALGAVCVAIAYVGFFQLNAWMFSNLIVSDNIAWVFLPAAVRMIAVLLIGWAGVIGLFIGSLAVILPELQDEPSHALALGVLSSLPPLLAAQAVRKALSVPVDLAGMTGMHLLLFGIAGGLANSIGHALYFAARAQSLEPLGGFVPMFVGDTVGTFLMLYASAMLLRRLRLPVR